MGSLYKLNTKQIADLVWKIEIGKLKYQVIKGVHNEFCEKRNIIMKQGESMSEFNRGIYYQKMQIDLINEQINLGECILLIMSDLNRGYE